MDDQSLSSVADAPGLDSFFDTPAFEGAPFEALPEERLELLATSRRMPMRLAASTLIKVNARTSRSRNQPDGFIVEEVEFEEAAFAAAAGEASKDGGAAVTDGVGSGPDGAPSGGIPSKVSEVHAGPEATELPVQTDPAADHHPPAETAAERERSAALDRRVRAAVGRPGPAEWGPQNWKDRWSRFLDAWAAREVESGDRLERRLLPWTRGR